MFDLERFTKAQDHQPWTTAVHELRNGAKRSHWIWWVFPQLASLGTSPQAQRFGLDGLDEAVAYLGDDVLVVRLVACFDALLGNRPRSVVAVMGGDTGWDVDTLKLVSCATLFREASARALREDVRARCDALLAWAFDEGYPRCGATLAVLARP
jgi:uncharacterized protein (DUF1810 family)